MALRFHSTLQFSSPELAKGISICAPASGKIVPIEPADPALIGPGVKIRLEAPKIISPINGRVTEINPSLGQITLEAKNKLRVLMHLPYDYQEFLGQGIKSLVRVGANVTKGTTIFEFDLFKMQLNLKPLYLYVILLNSDSFKRIDVPLRHVEQNTDTLFSLIPTKKK